MVSARDQFFGGFYRDPRPEVAIEAFVEVAQNDELEQANASFIFSLAAYLHPSVADALREFAKEHAHFRQPISDILDTIDALPEMRSLPLDEPEALDYMWALFLMTGDLDPVDRIASVLSRKDRVLEMLSEWLGERVFLPWAVRRKRAQATHLEQLGFNLDQGCADLGNTIDLDLWVWKQMASGMQLKRELPFQVKQDLITHLMIKGAACWSLQSNAQQHPKVRELYLALPCLRRLPSFVEGPIA